jgi:hypothetical protein
MAKLRVGKYKGRKPGSEKILLDFLKKPQNQKQILPRLYLPSR